MAARRRRPGLKRRGLPAGVVALAVGLSVVAFTAANAVPASSAGRTQQAITVDDLKPDDCAGITVTTLLVGAGTITGTSDDELIIGSPGVDTIDGDKGDDCILGGGGNDSLRGSQQKDVCIGGPGIDTFHATCETQIQ